LLIVIPSSLAARDRHAGFLPPGTDAQAGGGVSLAERRRRAPCMPGSEAMQTCSCPSSLRPHALRRRSLVVLTGEGGDPLRSRT
jgi:hypothetical protein